MLGYTIDHIGIAVSDLDDAISNYLTLTQSQKVTKERVVSQKVEVAFIYLGAQKLELLAPLEEDSPVQKFLDKRGPGMHHIAYKVENIKEEIARLKEKGLQFIHNEPFIGAGGKWVCFLHPKSTGGVLTELCQYRSTEEE